MTRKDYIKIARALKENTLTDTNGVYFLSDVEGFINSLCDILQADNPRFNKELFKRACMPN